MKCKECITYAICRNKILNFINTHHQEEFEHIPISGIYGQAYIYSIKCDELLVEVTSNKLMINDNLTGVKVAQELLNKKIEAPKDYSSSSSIYYIERVRSI